MKKLYKIDSKGKTRTWFAEARDDKLHVFHGIDGGKLIEDITTCTPKNLGRSNETTGPKQAANECIALYTKKQTRDGYTDDLSTTSDETLYPMLARDYSKLAHQLKTESFVWLSPKLDGVRAIWRHDKQKFQSRKGTYYNVPHLEAALKDTIEPLDGELYLHGTPLNRIVAAVRKPNPLTPVIGFRVFDLVSDNGFAARASSYATITKRLYHPQITAVPQTFDHISMIKARHDEFVTDGYEGVMIRRDGPYEIGTRSNTLYKYKEFLEDEFKVIEVIRDKKGQGVLRCETNGLTFDCRCRGTDAEREHQANHPEEYKGKMLTVRYFARTEYGLPQFPIGITIRDY